MVTIPEYTPQEIRTLRESLNLTQGVFGKAPGLTGANCNIRVCGCEKGNGKPSVTARLRLQELAKKAKLKYTSGDGSIPDWLSDRADRYVYGKGLVTG